MGGPAGRRPSDVILCTPIGPRVAFDATWAGTRNTPPVQEETGGGAAGEQDWVLPHRITLPVVRLGTVNVRKTEPGTK